MTEKNICVPCKAIQFQTWRDEPVLICKQGCLSASKLHAHFPITNFQVSYLVSYFSSSLFAIRPYSHCHHKSGASFSVQLYWVGWMGVVNSNCSICNDNDDDNDSLVTHISCFACLTGHMHGLTREDTTSKMHLVPCCADMKYWRSHQPRRTKEQIFC